MPLRLEWPGSRLYKFIHSRWSLVLSDMISTFSSRGRGEASRGESLDLILGTGLSIVARRPRGPPERFTFATRNFLRDRCDPIILLIRGRSTEPHSLRNAPRHGRLNPRSLSVFLSPVDASLITRTFGIRNTRFLMSLFLLVGKLPSDIVCHAWNLAIVR